MFKIFFIIQTLLFKTLKFSRPFLKKYHLTNAKYFDTLKTIFLKKVSDLSADRVRTRDADHLSA
jgi:hypothetical protein